MVAQSWDCEFMAKKILLDTDIGSDIDDAVCLAYLLANPECDLLGITTVTGQPVERARMTSAMCRAAGKDVPIFAGLESPLLIRQRQPEAPQSRALANWPHQRDFPCGADAILFLRDTIRAHPGEITLLTIGPLTNIGVLFSLDPEIPSLLKGMFIMGGAFIPRPGQYEMEWNEIVDPHAAAIVYSRPPQVQRSIGIDVTLQVQMDAQQVRQRFRSALLQPVLDFAEVWFREQDVITFHDPLAAACIFDPTICRFESGRIDIETTDPDKLGKTSFTPDLDAQQEVALEVQPDRFFKHFFSMFE